MELIYDVDAGVPEVVIGDPFWLQEVITRLADNAIEFTKAGEVIVRIEMESKGESDIWLHFTVIDTGNSNPPEAYKMLFDASTRWESPTMWKDGTSGPGLLVASRLVGVMGGKIWAESSPTQPGNIFHFTARFWDDKGSLSKPALTPIEELRGLPVLIVDDNASNRRVLVEMLRRWGMKPTAADGGEAALQILKERNTTGATFELIMLDAEMPGMDGFAVARRLQDNLELAGATIMMHSAVIEGDLAVHCRQVGSDHLRKPILQAELLEALRCFVSRVPLRMETRRSND